MVEDNLEEMVSVIGVEDTGERLLGKLKQLIPRIKDAPDQKQKLKSFLLNYANQISELAKKIDTSKTRWQRIRGY